MCIDQARHDEFARASVQFYEVVLAVIQPAQGDGVVEDRYIEVLLDPNDVTVRPDGNQAPRESEIVCQRLRIYDWAKVEVDHDDTNESRSE